MGKLGATVKRAKPRKGLVYRCNPHVLGFGLEAGGKGRVRWNNLVWKARLPSTEKLVRVYHLYLLDRSNAEGRSWPLVDTIASETVLSWGFHGRGNVYQVHPEALEGLAQSGGREG